MPLQVPEANRTRQKDFNGIRRTKEGMLYLTHVVRETSSDSIEVSKFFEDGKSDLLPKDGQTNYTQERLELFNTQSFTGDGSTSTFTISPSFNIKPTSLLAANKGDNKGLLFLSIGVGTVMIKILHSFKSCFFEVNSKNLCFKVFFKVCIFLK